MTQVKELTFKRKVEKLPTPIILWTKYNRRFFGVVVQYLFMLFASVLTVGLLALFTGLVGVFVPLIVVGSIGSLITGLVFAIGYFEANTAFIKDDASYANAHRMIQEGISEAAKRSLKDKDSNVKLSEFLHLNVNSYCVKGGDEEYLGSLNSRHIKWATKYYNKRVKEIQYAITEGARKHVEDIANKKKALDGASNSELTRQKAYHIAALKELEKTQYVSSDDELESELAKLVS